MPDAPYPAPAGQEDPLRKVALLGYLLWALLRPEDL